MSATPKPVTIITGFLGAGKTTYLNYLLQENRETRYAIIENEFGEQGIDGELVIQPDETIVELNNGCLCCTLNDNLYDILNDLYDRRDAFDEIIIEATGVADPTGLAQPFITHPLIKKQFPLQGVVCIVDAVHVEDQLEETEEARNQIAYSDVLLINKTDLVSPHYVTELEMRLQQLNPLARITSGNKQAFQPVEWNQGQSPLDELFEHIQGRASEVDDTRFPVTKPHSHHHHDHTEEIVSQTFYFDEPFNIPVLQHQLMVYLLFQSSGLYRMKGIVWAERFQNQYVIQSVGSRLDVEERTVAPDKDKARSVIVFIGKNLQRKGIARLLNNCLYKSQPIQT